MKAFIVDEPHKCLARGAKTPFHAKAKAPETAISGLMIIKGSETFVSGGFGRIRTFV